MKKLALLACSLFAFAAVAQAKEVVAPVTSSKEVVNEPVIMEEIVPVVANPWGYINIRGGWDFWSEYGSNSNNEDLFNLSNHLSSKTKDFGGEVALEAYKKFDKFDLGLGVAYQDHMGREATSDEFITHEGVEFKSVPVYLTGRYNVNYWDWAVTPYIKANLGYSFNFDSQDYKREDRSFSTSVDDGLYWAAGLGMEYQSFNMDILYGSNQAKSKIDLDNGFTEKFDNDYDRVTLSVGYSFNIW
ncbi:MAG: hypothetical protein ACRCZ0_02910 [Cetobacterium sp.]